ncbi:DUF3631 domain-containing protein [Candidatus Solirubrobacter pratensis]|uniref:DUF3631 domain-containing protein n=1 Tax=Candidatus Solirubrobacter pratensis TaxID=1298857 RepID=UPI00040348B7|nr:DUF3631 domain-containing protein [Candidatus Solirubrobacter pratensis]
MTDIERASAVEPVACQTRQSFEAREGGTGPAVLLDEVSSEVGSYIALRPEQTTAVALWVLHAHAVEGAEVTPYLAITSAEKRSGKSLLLLTLQQLVPHAWYAIAPTEAVLYRKIARDRPTLLLDEVDTFFGRNAAQHEGVRALLNAGHRRGATVPRCVGKNYEVHDFPTFCAKALAAIGELPDTVADRSIQIRLRRRAVHETVARSYRREVEARLTPLRDRIAEWAVDATPALVDARPAFPEALHDRAADAWEPLFAIADAAGGDWPESARRAAILLSGGQLDDGSLGIRLLADIQEVFAHDDRLSTTELVRRLHGLAEAPWSEIADGRPLTAARLAALLRAYDISSRQIRLPDRRAQGYHRHQFEDAWSRYLPATPSGDRHVAPDNPDTDATAAGANPSGWMPTESEAVARQARHEPRDLTLSDFSAELLKSDRTLEEAVLLIDRRIALET